MKATSLYPKRLLPKITKKIIYLDQFVISDMVKEKQPHWIELRKKLAAWAHLQLIVCPFSNIHRDESLLCHSLRDELKRMYRSFGNTRFRNPHEIEQSQLLASIRHWLNVSDSSSGRLWRDAFDCDPHSWASDFQVFADFPVHEPWVADLRTRKESLHSALESVCKNWRDENRKFNEDVEREAISYGRALIEVYRELANGRERLESMMPDDLKRVYRACMGPDQFDPRRPPGVQPGVLLVHWLAAEVQNARPDGADPVAIVEQFFQSSEAMDTPFLYITSRLWAALAQNVRSLKGPRQLKRGDNNDIRAIATFAPYCDAMFIDNEFHELASKRTVDVPGKFGVRLFSTKTLAEFLAYLDEVLRETSDSHREGLSLVYPQLATVLGASGRRGRAP